VGRARLHTARVRRLGGGCRLHFQAAEIEGTVVGLQRLRPYAPGLVWYEGLRVASTHRRQGLARTMLASAIAEAKDQDFERCGWPPATRAPLDFSRPQGSSGGSTLDGGAPGEWKVVSPLGSRTSQRPRSWWAAIRTSPGLDLYRGVTADFNGARDLDAAELERLGSIGMLRAGPGGRAVVGLRDPWGENLAVGFVAGQGGALRELLMSLRFEADADGLDHVTVALPRDHPAAGDMTATDTISRMTTTPATSTACVFS